MITFLVLTLIYSLALFNAQTITNSIINTSVSNLTINVLGTIYLDQLIVESDSIEFQNLQVNLACANKLSFIITEVNRSYLDSDLPYFKTCTTESIVIDTNLDNPINVIFSNPLKNTYPFNSLKSVNLNGVPVSFSNNENLSVNISSLINNGDNSFDFDYTLNPQTNNVCNNLFLGYLSFNPWITFFTILGLVVLISIVGIMIYVLNKNNELNAESVALNLDGMTYKLIFFIVLVIVILLIISLVVIQLMCSFG